MFKQDQRAIVDSVFRAGEQGVTRTEIASFDSIGQRYGLLKIRAPRFHPKEAEKKYSGVYELIFFSDELIGERGPEAETVRIAQAYCQLPYVEDAFPVPVIRIPDEDTLLLPETWGSIKGCARSPQVIQRKKARP